MQIIQYVFYSLISLQKHRVCVKRRQNKTKQNRYLVQSIISKDYIKRIVQENRIPQTRFPLQLKTFNCGFRN